MMARTKATSMLAIAALVAATSLTAAQDFQVQSVESVVAIDGKLDCMHTKSMASQPCDGFTPPPKVAVGEKFIADGKTREIGVIRAHQAEDDMQAYGIKKGEWICVAAETLEDIPVDQSRDRTWLGIPKCQPDLAGSAPLLPPG
jgi:hypothetical protein